MKERALSMAARLEVQGRIKDMGRPPVKDTEREAAALILELQSRLESLEKVKVYKIGEATNRLVFQANGIENVSDMQRVFDAVEVVLESLKTDAARYREYKENSHIRFSLFSGCYRADNGFSILTDWIESFDECFDAAMQANKGE